MSAIHVEVLDGEVTVTEAERAELERLGAGYATLCAESSRIADAAMAELTAAMVRLLRERDEARADAARLRAALRRFAEVFREPGDHGRGYKCGVCGDAWGEQGYEHSSGCAVGDALTEAAR